MNSGMAEIVEWQRLADAQGQVNLDSPLSSSGLDSQERSPNQFGCSHLVDVQGRVDKF